MNEQENVRYQDDWGAVVALFRMLRGWSQTQLAEAAGMDKSQISRYESRDEIPKRATVERLATAAGVPIPLIEHIRWFLKLLRETMENSKTAGPAALASSGPVYEIQQRVGSAVERSVVMARTELEILGSRRSGQPGLLPGIGPGPQIP